MAKKKHKKKNRHEREPAATPVAAQDKAAAISASALASFSRDITVFGSRPEKPEGTQPVP